MQGDLPRHSQLRRPAVVLLSASFCTVFSLTLFSTQLTGCRHEPTRPPRVSEILDVRVVEDGNNQYLLERSDVIPVIKQAFEKGKRTKGVGRKGIVSGLLGLRTQSSNYLFAVFERPALLQSLDEDRTCYWSPDEELHRRLVKMIKARRWDRRHKVEPVHFEWGGL